MSQVEYVYRDGVSLVLSQGKVEKGSTLGIHDINILESTFYLYVYSSQLEH